MQCAHQQRGVRGDFVNLRDLPAQAAVYTHRCRVACMYTEKLSEFVREPEDDFDKKNQQRVIEGKLDFSSGPNFTIIIGWEAKIRREEDVNRFRIRGSSII